MRLVTLLFFCAWMTVGCSQRSGAARPTGLMIEPGAGLPTETGPFGGDEPAGLIPGARGVENPEAPGGAPTGPTASPLGKLPPSSFDSLYRSVKWESTAPRSQKCEEGFWCIDVDDIPASSPLPPAIFISRPGNLFLSLRGNVRFTNAPSCDFRMLAYWTPLIETRVNGTRVTHSEGALAVQSGGSVVVVETVLPVAGGETFVLSRLPARISYPYMAGYSPHGDCITGVRFSGTLAIRWSPL